MWAETMHDYYSDANHYFWYMVCKCHSLITLWCRVHFFNWVLIAVNYVIVKAQPKCTPTEAEIALYNMSLCHVNSPSYSAGSSQTVRQTAITWVQASTMTNISQQKRASVWFTFSAVDSVHNCRGHHQLSLTLNILQWCLEIALPGAHFINLTNLLQFPCIITLHNLSQRGRLG